ncbi:MAG TPA: GNAT family N-acetyltransferase [Verrucomicrobiae bacterium]|nr:GNAT family N-acetyltransferase [Verrucomicrobiae bacterium]
MAISQSSERIKPSLPANLIKLLSKSRFDFRGKKRNLPLPAPVSQSKLNFLIDNALPPLRFETSTANVIVHKSAANIVPEVQARAFQDELKNFYYQKISAETLAGQFEHFFLQLQDKQSGQIATQPVFIADQDLLDGLQPRFAKRIAMPRKIFPQWLKARILFAGCSAGSGALDCSEPWAVAALQEALEKFARKSGATMILLKDFPAKFRAPLESLTESGKFRRVPSMPGCTLELDFATFEEFMTKRLGRKLRYKYIKLNKQPPIPFEVVTDVSAMADELYALYLQTHSRSKMRFERLTPEFFARIGREMPHQARFFIWRVNGKIAAFALCLVHDGIIEHLNIGFDYAIAFDLQLYYVTIRDILCWSLDHKLKRYETGQLNYDPKLHLQMKLAPLDLYAGHVSPLINPIFKFALEFLQPVRHEPILKQFPNADKL